ncbi:PAS domain-containing protein [Jezberella montanilacus]|uniref:PAS domain-containing protein n=1 Tax=Jezberella montanilacus TaxID=323426 RepID=A0A2T0XGZ6_9BURK|nr:helix-turn-helix transcriptional regulator [Jezberella montanilacus]PRY98185.1 PAS domain-containing protein [Jezberella montanilacus]
MKKTNLTFETIEVDVEFMNALQAPVFIKNRDGIYTYCNEAFLQFLDLPENRVLGHTAYDIAPVALAKSYTAADKALFDSCENQTYQSVVQQTSGLSKVVFTKAILKDPSNKTSGFIGTVRPVVLSTDITASTKNNLTQREAEVLNLLMTGESIKRIAVALVLSRYTVSDHLKSIYRKLDVHSKNEAMYKALGNNHLSFEDNRKWA